MNRNDGGWAQIVRDQVKFFKTEVGGKLSQATDYAKIAEGMGAVGFTVKHEDELEPTFKKAQEVAKTKPVLVNILIGKTAFREGSISV
jgi:acetolactate synthase-like protein